MTEKNEVLNTEEQKVFYYTKNMDAVSSYTYSFRIDKGDCATLNSACKIAAREVKKALRPRNGWYNLPTYNEKTGLEIIVKSGIYGDYIKLRDDGLDKNFIFSCNSFGAYCKSDSTKVSAWKTCINDLYKAILRAGKESAVNNE